MCISYPTLPPPRTAKMRGRRLILFPLPLQGHLNPMLQLANLLHSYGFHITILHTTFNSPSPSRYPHLTFRPIQESLPHPLASASDLVTLLKMLNLACRQPFKAHLAELVSVAGGEDTDEAVPLLVSDAIWNFTQDVANEVKVPRIVLRTGGAASFCAFASFPLLREKGYLHGRDFQGEDPVLELPPLRVKDLPVIQTNDPEGLYRIIDGMVNGAKDSLGVIWNTFEELEDSSLATLRQKLQVPLFPIGPLNLHSAISQHCQSVRDPSPVISWLDSHRANSVVYVSFGSTATISEDEFLEIASGLILSNQAFLWVVRPGLVQGSEWIESLPRQLIEDLNEKGRIVKWVEQGDVLAHRAVGAFWTHCGWNSTMESVSEGVATICMPCFTDQKVNARYLVDVWMIGVWLEKDSNRRKIKEVIRRVMLDKEGMEIRERALSFRHKAHQCLNEHGSSAKSIHSLINHIRSLKL